MLHQLALALLRIESASSGPTLASARHLLTGRGSESQAPIGIAVLESGSPGRDRLPRDSSLQRTLVVPCEAVAATRGW